MKTSHSFGLAFGIFIFLFSSCGPSGKERSRERLEAFRTADSISKVATANASVPLAVKAPEVPTIESSNSFLRTANIKFRVQDVKQATFRIEDIVSNHWGYIEYTHLNSAVSHTQSTPLSEDSLQMSHTYHITNTFTIQIPNQELDSALKEMAVLIDFLDDRTITADNVKNQYYANVLAEKRLQQQANRMAKAAGTSGKNQEEMIALEDERLMKQSQADQARINNRNLMEGVRYSVVKLNIYQAEFTKAEIVAIPKTIEPYQPGFFKKFGAGCAEGWHMIEVVLIFISRIWSVLLILLLLFFGIRRLVIKHT